jgi:hypothetical protein
MKMGSSAAMHRLRIEGSVENDDGTFGAWIRFNAMNALSTTGDINGKHWEEGQAKIPNISGLAWWKPIDMFKLSIGGNPDGLYGKEG